MANNAVILSQGIKNSNYRLSSSDSSAKPQLEVLSTVNALYFSGIIFCGFPHKR